MVLVCQDLGFVYKIALPEGATVTPRCEVTLPDEPEWFRLCGDMILDVARLGDLFDDRLRSDLETPLVMTSDLILLVATSKGYKRDGTRPPRWRLGCED